MLQTAGLGLVALALSYVGVAGVRYWAEHRQVLDIPNERSSHTRPVPRGGGLAIAIVTLAGWLLLTSLNAVASWPALLAYTSGAALIALVSWLDDLYSLPKWVRFATHSLGAILALWHFGPWYMVDLPLLGRLSLGWLGLPITFLWIVGLTNAYNFMDGIDGIAGGQAVVAGCSWAIVGWLGGQPLLGGLGLLLATSSLGFLGHNWPPARVFMGDVGSAFLGYTFSVLPLIAAQHNPRLTLAGVLLLWPFVFDTFFTFLCRLHRGEDVFSAHRSHLYQRLVIAGASHHSVTVGYICLALTGSTLMLSYFLDFPGSPLMVVLLLPMLCLALWSFVVLRERRLSIVAKRAVVA
jgi:UDP-N-acetylmuramyl pentapeptide phosphotransferase/UDP-N-acetylglucosamine-1-phosphate transferase